MLWPSPRGTVRYGFGGLGVSVVVVFVVVVGVFVVVLAVPAVVPLAVAVELLDCCADLMKLSGFFVSSLCAAGCAFR